MATSQPIPKGPLWMQNVDYPASWDRALFDNLFPNEGVLHGLDLTLAGGLNYTINAGAAIVKGDETAGQGKYLVDSDGTISINSDPVGSARIDYICLLINDPAEAGGRAGNNATIAVVSAIPANSAIPLYQITLPASTPNVTSAMVTDLRDMVGVGMAASSVTAVEIANQAVTTIKLADQAVTTIKLADQAVTAAKIALNTITSGQIAANAVTSTELANNAVDAAAIQANAVETAKLADLAVSSQKLADGAVTAAKIWTGAVTEAKIAGGAVTEGKIGTGAVTVTKLADGTITGVKIANGTITEPKLANNSVTTVKIANGNVTNAKLADGSVTTSKLVNGSVTNDKLAWASVTRDKIQSVNISSLWNENIAVSLWATSMLLAPQVGAVSVVGATGTQGTVPSGRRPWNFSRFPVIRSSDGAAGVGYLSDDGTLHVPSGGEWGGSFIYPIP